MNDHSLPHTVHQALAQLIGFALNRLLALDTNAQMRMHTLEGQQVQLQLQAPAITLAISVHDGQLVVSPATGETDASLRLKTHPLALVNKLIGVPPGNGRYGTEIAGDADLARQIQTIAANYSPDIEAACARYFGDVLGVPLARVSHRVLTHMKDSAMHAAEDTSRWLQEDSGLSVSTQEADMLFDQIDAVAARTQKLEQRLEAIMAKRAGGV